MGEAMTSGSASASELQCQLCCGDWQVELADVGEVDTLVCDPPYSERTHAGMFVGKMKVQAAQRPTASGKRRDRAYGERSGVSYAAWSPADVAAFVQAWSSRVRGWFVVITDDQLAPVFQSSLTAAGRYTFQPLPFLEMGKQPRLTGDGPASWTCWVIVARPRHKPFSCWGSLPGGYVPPPSVVASHGDRVIKGGKPLWLMRALVRDYSRPGDLIVDPCAGGGTTLIAARMEGRRSIGAERDPATFELARKRIAKPYTPLLFGDELRARAAVAVANDNGVDEQAALRWADSDVDP